MLRLATPDYLRFCQANQFNATFGGGEANVAASLANYAIETEFVTRLPKMTSPVPALWNYANRVSEHQDHLRRGTVRHLFSGDRSGRSCQQGGI